MKKICLIAFACLTLISSSMLPSQDSDEPSSPSNGVVVTEWVVDNLQLRAAPDPQFEVELVIPEPDETIEFLDFDLSAGVMHLALGHLGYLALDYSPEEGHLLASMVSGSVVFEHAFPIAPGHEGRLRFDFAEQVLQLHEGDALDISEWLSLAGEVPEGATVLLTNVGSSDIRIESLVIGTTAPLREDATATTQIQDGDLETRTAGTTIRAVKVNRDGVPLGLPPPHPWLVTDENRRPIGMPVGPDGENLGSLHRRPGLVPQEVTRRILREAREAAETESESE